ncbi:hypothetical protein KOR34_24330 [Posidoniimonas corsicana]|uniref:Uncharacterized protein n=1 Tax=Posidoniimonas corsicana TaxID=1938618 RepID=A0A5C5VH95_9BACT|nr:hypothetical protein [Posidoniimonas corsicana]TWT37481.1 hypothetical protein KOR34_24330 [Posidoniimonas corsicana]
MEDQQYPPPPHLSPRAVALWHEYVPEKARSAGRLALVQTALESLDRADAARAEVEAAGMTTTTKSTGAVHVHPLIKVEREGRQMFAKLWGELGFHWTNGVDRR